MSTEEKETRRKIVAALGLSPYSATLLLEGLDERYAKKLTAKDVREAMGAVARRHGLHVDPLGPVLGSVRMVPETPTAPAPPTSADAARWGVWCEPRRQGYDGRKPGWLDDLTEGGAYVLRATNEAIAVEMNSLESGKHWHYEARPVLADGSPGPVLADGKPWPVPNDTIRARFEAPSPGVPAAPASAVSIEEHCLGADCADKAACECLCHKCNPVKQYTQTTCPRCGGFPALCNCP